MGHVRLARFSAAKLYTGVFPMFLAESSIQLVPDGTLLLHLFVVVVMVAVVNRTLLKPINKVLEERDKNILGQMEEASDLLKTRDQVVSDYNNTLREARTEGYHLIEKERSQAVKEKEERIRAFKAETSRKVQQELKLTRDQEMKVRGELEGEAQALSQMITTQILRHN